MYGVVRGDLVPKMNKGNGVRNTSRILLPKLILVTEISYIVTGRFSNLICLVHDHTYIMYMYSTCIFCH